MTPLGSGRHVSVSDGTGINQASVFVNDIKPAAQIVADLVRDAERSDGADAR